MDGRQYEQPGPFGRAMERALAEATKQVQPAAPLCKIGGCCLPFGHVERAGTDHQPVEWLAGGE